MTEAATPPDTPLTVEHVEKFLDWYLPLIEKMKGAADDRIAVWRHQFVTALTINASDQQPNTVGQLREVVTWLRSMNPIPAVSPLILKLYMRADCRDLATGALASRRERIHTESLRLHRQQLIYNPNSKANKGKSK